MCSVGVEPLALFEQLFPIHPHQMKPDGLSTRLLPGPIVTPPASGRMCITPSFIDIS